MDQLNDKTVTVKANIQASVEKVWHCWTDPQHIRQWNQASDDWHTPYADNDVRVGGTFCWRMEAKDGSFGFDMRGTYEIVNLHEAIRYRMEDGRQVDLTFIHHNSSTEVIETFEAETMNPVELQRQGWQAILNNFMRHVERI
jgi:uncharacterized protein YndB with AHSA1/START domain